MKFYVNDACIGCGLCNGVCPEVFQMTPDDVAKAIDTDVAAEFLDAAMQAKEECPVSAIICEEA